MIIVTITFICNLCKAINTHSEAASEFSEITIRMIDMTEGWSPVWVDCEHYDIVCGDCLDKYWDSIHSQRKDLWWLERPKLGERE